MYVSYLPDHPPAGEIPGQVTPDAICRGDIQQLLADYPHGHLPCEGRWRDSTWACCTWIANVGLQMQVGMMDDPRLWTLYADEGVDWAMRTIVVGHGSDFDLTAHPIVVEWYADPAWRDVVVEDYLGLFRCINADLAASGGLELGNLCWIVNNRDFETALV